MRAIALRILVGHKALLPISLYCQERRGRRRVVKPWSSRADLRECIGRSDPSGEFTFRRVNRLWLHEWGRVGWSPSACRV